MAEKPQKPLREWPVQDAKARFSELVGEAGRHGPQLVTRRGRPEAVLVSIEEWERMTKPHARNAIEVLMAPEARIDDLQLPDRKSYRSRRIPRF